jgi:predicted nucleic acid-binding protein
MILLDTNIVIAFFNGNKSVLREMHERIDSIALSVLVIAELDYGAKASQRARENLDKLYRLIDIVQIVPFDMNVPRLSGALKVNFGRLVNPQVKWLL